MAFLVVPEILYRVYELEIKLLVAARAGCYFISEHKEAVKYFGDEQKPINKR
ncbi:MAG: hypothetical protein SFW62_02480 [Alphaproteobacteria bacterium]|nr:hypothetical protein [Alphaproteobacteria bacterium]